MNEKVVSGNNVKDRIKLLLGPILFFGSVFLIPSSLLAYPIRGALGTFMWMSLWWALTPVNIAVTAFLPIVINAVFGFIPMGDILPQYAAELVILLMGSSMITATWEATGLNDRVALSALSIIGPSLKQQIAVWFIVSTVMSIFLPNVVVAAALTPIAVSMLQYVGKDDVSKSTAAANILVAIAWGAGLGGFGSPIGGGMNLVAIGYIEELTGTEFMYMDWVFKMMPMLIVISGVTILYMLSLKSEITSLPGTREYFREEFKKMGSMSREEKISAILFVVPILLAFGRPLYSHLLPAFKPPFAFMTFGILSFMMPGKMDGKLITWKYAQSKMTWGLFYMLAGGFALGTFITSSGAADVVSAAITNVNLSGGLGTVALFILLGMFLSNVSSNTAACAISIPIIISITNAIGVNPIPYIYITSVAANCAYVLPTSTRALPVAYGVKTDYLMQKGFVAILINFVIVLALGYLFLNYWPYYSV